MQTSLSAGRPRLVLDVELLQHFHLFEINGPKLELLRKLKEEHPGRDVNIYPVDFNEGVLALLRPEMIPERQATFCLIDQHTFECMWDTLKAIAAYKAGGYKIELFYFLGTGWLDRAMSATRDEERLRRWWGGEGYRDFLQLGAPERAFHFAKRLQDELGYKYVFPWAIHEKEQGGRIMYFMIHAADHPEAPKQMWRPTPRYSLTRPCPKGSVSFELPTVESGKSTLACEEQQALAPATPFPPTGTNDAPRSLPTGSRVVTGGR